MIFGLEFGVSGGEGISSGLQRYGDNLTTAIAATPSTADEVYTYTKHSNTAFDLAVTTVGTNQNTPLLSNTQTATVLGTDYLLEFFATVNSGTPTIRVINVGGGAEVINHAVTNGINKIYVTATGADTTQQIYFNGTQLFDVSVTNWNFAEIL